MVKFTTNFTAETQTVPISFLKGLGGFFCSFFVKTNLPRFDAIEGAKESMLFAVMGQ